MSFLPKQSKNYKKKHFFVNNIMIFFVSFASGFLFHLLHYFLIQDENKFVKKPVIFSQPPSFSN